MKIDKIGDKEIKTIIESDDEFSGEEVDSDDLGDNLDDAIS